MVTVNMNDNSLSQDAQITIYNLLGQTVTVLPLITQVANMNLQNQATGYYLVSIRNAGVINTKRIVIAN